MTEVWAPVPGWEGWHEVSTLGRVRRLERRITRSNGRTLLLKQRLHRQCPTASGHLRVGLKCGPEGRQHFYQVHRLVLIAFVGEPPEGAEACHNNGVATDNRLENLRWDTRLANTHDKRRDKPELFKLTEAKVREMRRLREETGLSYPKIAAMFGCSYATARSAILGEHYAWVH